MVAYHRARRPGRRRHAILRIGRHLTTSVPCGLKEAHLSSWWSLPVIWHLMHLRMSILRVKEAHLHRFSSLVHRRESLWQHTGCFSSDLQFLNCQFLVPEIAATVPDLVDPLNS